MNTKSVLLLTSLFSIVPLTQALAQDAEGVRCVTLSRIDRTDVIDDQHIAFYMRNGDIYLNRLSRSCPGLDDRQPFSYRTATGRLCSIDTITVLENYGFGLSRGATCGLNRFVLTDEDALDVLKGEREEPEVTIEEVEVTVEEIETEE
ncbi:MAG: DUF6491 family protein [Gammaproteobacteria bacterium]|nr:DUF6491 family protein [Gammaproteobacteria bacterium]